MFESTLEAQALHESDRRFGTMSAAALAHVVFGVTIVSVTALIVPPVHPPELPPIVITVAPPIPVGDVTPHPAPLPPPEQRDRRRDAHNGDRTASRHSTDASHRHSGVAHRGSNGQLAPGPRPAG